MNELIKVGAKVRLTYFRENEFCEVLKIISDNHFVSIDEKENIDKYSMAFDWLPYEEQKKKVMMYPALMRTNGSFPHYYMTDTLYEKELGDSVDTFVRLVKELGIEVEQ